MPAATGAGVGGSSHLRDLWPVPTPRRGARFPVTVRLPGRGPVVLPQCGAISRANSSGTALRDPRPATGGNFSTLGRCAAEPLARTRASAALAALYSEQTRCTVCDCSTLTGPAGALSRRFWRARAPATRTASPREAGPFGREGPPRSSAGIDHERWTPRGSGYVAGNRRRPVCLTPADASRVREVDSGPLRGHNRGHEL